ncbi:MAG: beta-L-arabinofuranosidase domain-containing protein [Fimbriimonadaceae bacterium]
MILATSLVLTVLQGSLAKLEAVPFTQVTINDKFWAPRQEINRTVTVEHSLKMLEKAGNILVMELAAANKREGFQGLLFTDSDLYKVLEGVSFTLATHPNAELSKRTDALIAKMAAAQQQDGYLNTWFQVTRPDDKFKNLRDWHELYCAGHMIEAAVAHHQATGKKNLLNIALKYAELINQKFGPNGKVAYCGHPEIELALIKLWKDTGDRKWFELSNRMVVNRGNSYFAQEHNTPAARYDGTYWLDDCPINDHQEIKGHAVRAAYLLSGATDVARETGNPDMIKMLRRVWRNATEKRIFVTGGIGPSGSNEGFTVDYDLPNMSAYQETCATIAMALWGHRMSLLFADSKYADTVETALYNGLLSGISLKGDEFFYVNPLASMGNHHRREWYACACCPPNVLRTIASLGGYAYATSDTSIYVNLFVGGSMHAKVGKQDVGFDVVTNYPWDNTIKFVATKPGNFALRIRKPGWCDSAKLSQTARLENGYYVVDRTWKSGDTVTVELAMPVVQVLAHPMVKDDLNRATVRRGPLVYCLEQVDNPVPIDEIIIPQGAPLKTKLSSEMGGIIKIEAQGMQAAAPEWERQLYQAAPAPKPVTAVLIPYGYWDNRKAGRMEVWPPTVPPPSRMIGPEAKAQISVSFKSGNAQLFGINDGVEPTSSSEQPRALLHFWPHKGGSEWVQYTWTKPVSVKGIKLYWFDDTGRGECRIPASWKLQSLIAGTWQDVKLTSTQFKLNAWCESTFATLSTTSLRVVVEQQPNWASGIHEWKVVLSEDED